MADDISTLDVVGAVARNLQTHVSVLLNGKNYLKDRKAFMAHLRMEALEATLLRGVATYAFTSKSMPEFQGNVGAFMGRALCYTTTTRTLEAIAVRVFSERTAGALMKDVTKSALRKYARYQDKALVASLVYVTALRASLLPNLAVQIVELAIEKFQRPRQITLKELMGIAQCYMAAVTGAAAGAALGSLFAYGEFTTLGLLVGEMIAYSIELGPVIFAYRDWSAILGYFMNLGPYKVFLEYRGKQP